MVYKIRQEFRKYYRNRKKLRSILKDTQRTLRAIVAENFLPDGEKKTTLSTFASFFNIFDSEKELKNLILYTCFFVFCFTENIMENLLSSETMERISKILENSPAIVIMGQNTKAKASLVNSLLSTALLPLCEDGSWRWIRIVYGDSNQVSLTLNLEYEVVDKLRSNEISWNTLPVEDLTRSENSDENCHTVLEIKVNKQLLRENVEIFVAPDNIGGTGILAMGIFKILPVFFYALGEEPLDEENLRELRDLKESHPECPVLFISSFNKDLVDSNNDTELTESEQHRLEETVYDNGNEPRDEIDIDKMNILGLTWLNQIASLGFLTIEESVEVDQHSWLNVIEKSRVSSQYINSREKIDEVFKFTELCLQNYLVSASNMLNDVHTKSLKKFILSAFDMARELQITPRRMNYAKEKENELYNSLMKLVSEKQEEVTDIIQEIIDNMKNELNEKQGKNYHSESINLEVEDGREWCDTVRAATSEIQRLLLNRLSERVAKQLVTSVDCLRETFVGTLQRCLLSLEKSYEHDSSLLASDALKQILSAAYNVELTDNSTSLVQSFLERMRQLIGSLPLPWFSTPTLDASWRKRVAVDILNSLNSARLSKAIATQFRDKVKASHDSFQAALRSLENHYSGRLERTEEQRRAIRKYHAPRLAKLALESTSMSDMVRFGIPRQGKEIGRGQYGVVFSCESWGGAPGPCAVKSVVPPDEKHWNDLAMEFYYTRSIPDHKRIVKLRGSVIDDSYGGGCGLSAAVLLVTDRLSRDLYCGIRAGLSWLERIQIATDVVEGIRYLHSQGLVHRDIKLKNVLLDTENRAKLTDLGFCIPEAMMSGSIVGTPVHMAPELLSGHYDSSVDVYAFGVLFWYICAGNVRLPFAFEQFHNKEQLWTNVRKGGLYNRSFPN